MENESILLYDVPEAASAESIEAAVSTILVECRDEISAILGKYEVPAASRGLRLESPICVTYKGAGVDPLTIAVAISLTPLVKAIVPLLQPFSKSAAKVSERVALDIWDLVKSQLWGRHRIRLESKPGRKH